MVAAAKQTAAPAAPAGPAPVPLPPGEQDRRSCAKVMLHVSKQLRSIKQRTLLRLEQSGRLDRAAAGSYEAWVRARGAAARGGYLRPTDAAAEEAARELEKLVVSALLEPTVTLPILAVSLQNKLLTGKNSDRFRFLLSTLKLQGVDPVVLQLAFGPAQCLEVMDADVNGRWHLFIIRADGEAVARHTGVAPPKELLAANRAVSPWRLGAAGVNLAKAAALGVREWLPKMPEWPEALGRPLAWEPGPEKRRRLEAEGAARQQQQQQREQDGDQADIGHLVVELLQTPSAREQMKRREFESSGGASVRVPCPHLTKEACCAVRGTAAPCEDRHFKVIMRPWTKPELGNCTWLHNCHTYRCPRLHYEIDWEAEAEAASGGPAGAGGAAGPSVPLYMQSLDRPQWVTADVRHFDLTTLGKFQVIMADPPWEINQELPYGLMSDNEMRTMNLGALMDNGVIFLWVTARVLELGRELLERWGYLRVDELIWIKTNQLCQLSRGGRTGYLLNHSKEHCLVGVKGTLDENQFNKYLDCDVVMTGQRETSRKPDEMYFLLERLCPGGRKLEIFAREHNLRPGWISIGNQLQQASRLDEPDVRER